MGWLGSSKKLLGSGNDGQNTLRLGQILGWVLTRPTPSDELSLGSGTKPWGVQIIWVKLLIQPSVGTGYWVYVPRTITTKLQYHFLLTVNSVQSPTTAINPSHLQSIKWQCPSQIHRRSENLKFTWLMNYFGSFFFLTNTLYYYYKSTQRIYYLGKTYLSIWLISCIFWATFIFLQ